MPVQPSLGELISSQRAALGLTQARLAELVGRSPSTIRSWERDRTAPADRASVAALAAVLGLTEDEMAAAILGPTEPPPAAPPPTPVPVDQDESAVPGDEAGPAGENERAVALEVGHSGGRESIDSSSLRTPAPARDGSEAAAAPTVLSEVSPAREETAGAVARLPRIPSYLDNPEEVRTYRVRTVLTAALMIFILIVLIWAFREAREAFGLIFDDPVL